MTGHELAQYVLAAVGVAIAAVWFRMVRKGRDPLGGPATGTFGDLAIPLLLALAGWTVADWFVGTRIVPLRPGAEATHYAGTAGHAIVGVALLPVVLRRWPARAVRFSSGIWAGIAGGVAIFGLVGVVGIALEGVYALAGKELPTQSVVDAAQKAEGLAAVLPAAAAILLAPFAEEVLYRGALLGTLARTAPPATANAVQAVIFGLAHVIAEPALLPLAIPLSVVGWGAGWLALRTRSLWPSIVMHALFNGIQFAFIRTA